MSTTVDVAFLAMRTPHRLLAQMVGVARNILAHAALPIRFHVVAAKVPEEMHASACHSDQADGAPRTCTCARGH